MESTIEVIKRLMAGEVCNAPTYEQARALFTDYLPVLEDCKIIFASTDGVRPGYAVNKTLSSGYEIRSLFKPDHVQVLDANSIKARDAYDYRFDYSISLDTQTFSYLEPFLDGPEVNKDFTEIFAFLAKPDVNVDPLPYMIENLANLDQQRNAEKIFQKVRAYEVLRNLDLDYLQRRGKARSLLNAVEIDRVAEAFVIDMSKIFTNPEAMASIRREHNLYYLILLKMVAIKLGKRGEPATKKLIRFLSFCDSSLATIPLRETELARLYFESTSRLGFFSKPQRGYTSEDKTIFDVLENMAWDVYHVRHLEKCMGLNDERESDYTFHALLTRDRGLIQLMDLCPLRAVAVFKDQTPVLPVPQGSLRKHLSPIEADKFFSLEANQSRSERRAAARENLKALTLEAERELAQVAEVEPRTNREINQ